MPDAPADLPKECIACGRCLDVCPLFLATQREELTPKATHVLHRALRQGSDAIRPRQAEELAAMCLGCGRCATVCPQGLHTPEVVAAIRAGHGGWQRWLWGHWIARAGVLWPAAASLSRVLPAALPAARGLRTPDPAPWLRAQDWEPVGQGREVAIFPGCTATHLRPQWTATARRLLEQSGYKVVIPDNFACCGATLGHAGLEVQQRDMQRRNVEAWRTAGRPTLATFCASCRAGLMAYGDAGWDTGEAARFREAVQPLASLLGRATYCIDESTAPAAVVWHQPCHAREGNPDGPFLAAALGGRLTRQVTDRCCGLGGVMQLGGSGLPRRVAAACWEGLIPDGGEADTQVLTGCSGCTMHLGATAPARGMVAHWLDVIQT